MNMMTMKNRIEGHEKMKGGRDEGMNWLEKEEWTGQGEGGNRNEKRRKWMDGFVFRAKAPTNNDEYHQRGDVTWMVKQNWNEHLRVS